MKIILNNYDENHDEKINKLFNDARDELQKVDFDANETKKQIITKLAKDLEGKIPEETISVEIVSQLHDQISERFIRECLPEKYKQKYRVKNAKKQKKKSKQEESKLAVLPPLNQQQHQQEDQNIKTDEKEEQQKNKGYIITVVDGRSYIQLDDDNDKEQSTASSDDYLTLEDKSFNQTSYQPQQEQEQEQQLKEQNDHDLKESSSSKELDDETHGQIDAPENSSELITATENIASQSTSTSKYDNEADTPNDILPFEFSIIYRELRYHLTPLYSKIGDHGKVWFCGKINKKTGLVISTNLGRISQQQQQQQDGL